MQSVNVRQAIANSSLRWVPTENAPCTHLRDDQLLNLFESHINILPYTQQLQFQNQQQKEVIWIVKPNLPYTSTNELWPHMPTKPVPYSLIVVVVWVRPLLPQCTPLALRGDVIRCVISRLTQVGVRRLVSSRAFWCLCCSTNQTLAKCSYPITIVIV